MQKNSSVQKIISLGRSGQFHQMEIACKVLLTKKPTNFDGLHFLGVALSKQRKFDEAIKCIKQALLRKKNHAGALNNLGYVYLETACYEKALKYFNKSLTIDPQQPEALNNIGGVHLLKGNYHDALPAFKKSLKVQPACAITTDNLGKCLLETGKLREAIDFHIKANELDPSYPRSFINLTEALLLAHITDDALYVAQMGLHVSNISPTDKFELLIRTALISWLTGQLSAAQESLSMSSSIFNEAFSTYKNISQLRIFHTYLGKLLKTRRHNPELYKGNTKQALFFAGESHCLSPSETVINYHDEPFRVLSTFIRGCKAWHLGQSGPNKYKASFETLLTALPKGSKVVVGFGEIDCRAKEGFLLAFLKKDIDYRLSIAQTVESYVEFTSRVAKQHSHTLIFYGVPSPSNLVTKKLKVNEKKHLNEIVKLFNYELSKACSQKGWEILDVYNCIKNLNNDEESKYRVDNFHLHPKTLSFLFNSYLIAPNHTLPQRD